MKLKATVYDTPSGRPIDVVVLRVECDLEGKPYAVYSVHEVKHTDFKLWIN